MPTARALDRVCCISSLDDEKTPAARRNSRPKDVSARTPVRHCSSSEPGVLMHFAACYGAEFTLVSEGLWTGTLRRPPVVTTC